MSSIGMIEAFELSLQVGDQALDFDELLFMSSARKRKGCATIKSTLTPDDRREVIRLGMKCKEWQERNQ